MNILALIPARGGSKSIPRKNIRQVGGKPLIAYSIQQALASRLITRVIVSTDDEEIAGIAKIYGAEIPFLRPSQFAQDDSPDIDVFRHALEWLRTQEGYQPNIIVHLRPTMPLRRPQTIDRAISRLIEQPEADCLRSLSPAQQSPFKMWLMNSEGYLDAIVKPAEGQEPYNMPRQKLPLVFWQNGYIDVIRREVIVNLSSMTGKKILGFVIEEPCIDIDYERSLRQVERVLAGRPLDEELPERGELPS